MSVVRLVREKFSGCFDSFGVDVIDTNYPQSLLLTARSPRYLIDPFAAADDAYTHTAVRAFPSFFSGHGFYPFYRLKVKITGAESSAQILNFKIG